MASGLVYESTLVNEAGTATLTLAGIRSFSGWEALISVAGTLIFRDGTASGKKLWESGDATATVHRESWSSAAIVPSGTLHVSVTGGGDITRLSLKYTGTGSATPVLGGNRGA